MDLLSDLIALATGAEAPAAGPPRAQWLADKVRETATADTPLPDLEHTAVEQFEGLYKGGEYDPADADTMKALADVVDSIRTVQSERDAEKVARDAEVAALADRIRPQAAAEPAAAPVGENGGQGDGGQPQGQQQAGGDANAAGQAQQQAAQPPAAPPEAGGTEGGEAPPPADPGQPTAPAQPSPAPAAAPAPPATEPPTAAPPQPQGQQAPAGQHAQPVAASTQPARRPSTAQAVQAARIPAPSGQSPASPKRSYSITASAEVPDVPYGANLTIEQLAEAAAARFAALPVGLPASGAIKANVGRIHRHFSDDLRLTGDHSDIAKLDHIADEKRLPGGSLVAAVQKNLSTLTAAAQAPSVIQDVWCTPSETDYTLCPPLATQDGLLDLPTTGLPSRGGIRYPVWTQYPEQELDTARNGWHGHVEQYPEIPQPPNLPTGPLTDPQYFRSDGKGNPVTTPTGYPKKCIEGPCVDWKEVRQSLAYLCITSDILRDRTFPEGIQRFISDVLVHHAHFLNETYVNYISAHADKIPAFSVQAGAGQIGSTSLTVVDRLSLLITWFRNRYKMAQGSTLEIVAPEWFAEYLKRDIEKKNNRPFGAVSDAEIATLFAQYASRVQWIRDWQEIGDGAYTGSYSGGIMPPDAWPSGVKLMAYPAGSWVLSQGNIIQLGVQYDYQLLQENKYSSSFTEDAWMLVNRCNRTFEVQLTDLCANGAIGPFRDSCEPANSVAVSGAGTVVAGQTAQLAATATLASGATRDVTKTAAWSSSAEDKATVAQGLVSGKAAGTSTISAGYGGQHGDHDMTVTAAARDTAASAASDDSTGVTGTATGIDGENQPASKDKGKGDGQDATDQTGSTGTGTGTGTGSGSGSGSGTSTGRGKTK